MVLDLARSGSSSLSAIDTCRCHLMIFTIAVQDFWQMSDFRVALCTAMLGSSWYSSWRPTSPPKMGHLSTCRFGICNPFPSPLLFLFLTIFKVSNVVRPHRREIFQGNSGQSRCYSSDWRSYHSRWFGVPEVLHLPHSRSWISCCRSLDPDFRQKCHFPPKDSVLEEGSQLHIRRLQLPYVDRIHCHNSKSPHFLLSNLLMNSPFALIQLSYKPLGEPDPAIFYLGVAILLVRLFRKSYWVCCNAHISVHSL